MNIKVEIEKMIEELDWKTYVLPEKYLVDYIKDEFIPKLRNIIKNNK